MLSGSQGRSCVWLDAGSKMLESKVRSHRKLEEVVFVFTYCNLSSSSSTAHKSICSILKCETQIVGNGRWWIREGEKISRNRVGSKAQIKGLILIVAEWTRGIYEVTTKGLEFWGSQPSVIPLVQKNHFIHVLVPKPRATGGHWGPAGASPSCLGWRQADTETSRQFFALTFTPTDNLPSEACFREEDGEPAENPAVLLVSDSEGRSRLTLRTGPSAGMAPSKFTPHHRSLKMCSMLPQISLCCLRLCRVPGSLHLKWNHVVFWDEALGSVITFLGWRTRNSFSKKARRCCFAVVLLSISSTALTSSNTAATPSDF